LFLFVTCCGWNFNAIAAVAAGGEGGREEEEEEFPLGVIMTNI
jgi:hypothetical protein